MVIGKSLAMQTSIINFAFLPSHFIFSYYSPSLARPMLSNPSDGTRVGACRDRHGTHYSTSASSSTLLVNKHLPWATAIAWSIAPVSALTVVAIPFLIVAVPSAVALASFTPVTIAIVSAVSRSRCVCLSGSSEGRGTMFVLAVLFSSYLCKR